MVDIRRVMGDAPTTRETAGSSGRTRVTNVDFATPIKQAIGIYADYKKAKGKEEEASIENDASATLFAAVQGQDIELEQKIDAEAGEVQAKYLQWETQGMDKTAIARRKAQAINLLMRKYPGYSEVILKRASDLRGLASDLSADDDAERAIERKRQADAFEVVQAAVVRERGHVDGMTPDEIRNYYNTEVGPKHQQLVATANRLEELTAQSDVLTAEQKLEAQRLEERSRGTFYTLKGTEINEILNTQYENPQERVTALQNAKANFQATLGQYAGVLGSDKVNSIYGGLFQQFDQAITIAEQQLPGNARKVAEDELALLRASNDMQIEISRQNILGEVPDFARMEVLNSRMGNIFRDVLPQFERAGALQGTVRQVVSTFASAANADTIDDVPGTFAGSRSRSTPEQKAGYGREAASAFRATFLNPDMKVTPESQDLFAKSMAGIFNEANYTDSKRALQEFLPVLTDPRVVDFVKDNKLAPEMQEKANATLSSYIVDLQASAEKSLGPLEGKYKSEVGANGLIKLTPLVGDSFRGMGVNPATGQVSRRTVQSPLIDTKTLKRVENELNTVIKVHAHISGDTDYIASARELFGG